MTQAQHSVDKRSPTPVHDTPLVIAGIEYHSRLLTGTGLSHNVFVITYFEDSLFNVQHHVADFRWRVIATGEHLYLGHIGLDIGKEFHATAKHAVADNDNYKSRN